MAMVEFTQAYSEYLETQPVSYPTLSYPRLHALLLDCNRKSSPCASGCFEFQQNSSFFSTRIALRSLQGPRNHSPGKGKTREHFRTTFSALRLILACDDNFFPILKKEVTAVSRYFNSRVRWLLRIHLASGVTKCIFRLKTKQARDYSAMVQEGQRLVKYVSMTTLATRKLLEKYDKVHTSTEGSKFRTWLMAVHVEALQSPWLVELLALYFNLKLNKARVAFPEICPGCVCDLQSVKPMLSCVLHESLRLEIDATCSICLEIVYEPVALKCGHIFCFKCACSAASVSTVNGFKKAKKSAKCPLCREPGVYASAFHLRELDMLINRSCKDYCKKRFRKERKERLKQKDGWSQMPAGTAAYSMGFIDAH